MKQFNRRVVQACIAMFCLMGLLNIKAFADTPSSTPKIIINKAVKHDVSRPLSEMIRLVPRTKLGVQPSKKRVVPIFRIPHITPEKVVSDLNIPEALTVSPPQPLNVNLGIGFQGIGVGLGGYMPSSIPPDTNGAVGTTQFVQWVNTEFAVFDKFSGTLLAGPFPGNVIWSGFGGLCESTNEGDPIVLFDKLANRWVMTQFAFDTDIFGNPIPPFFQCIAVSRTDNALGTFHRYAFQFEDFNDYGKLGTWPTAYFMSFNMFDEDDDFLGPRVCAFERTAMLKGELANSICVQLGPENGTMMPADFDGRVVPPSFIPEYFLNFSFDNRLKLWLFKVNFQKPEVHFDPLGSVDGAKPFRPACGAGEEQACIPQKGTSNRLEVLSDRLMFRLAYRQFNTFGSMVTNHSIETKNSISGVRWYEIRVRNSDPFHPKLFQQGTISPDSHARWMGSIAMDNNADIAAGYSVSSHTLHPSIFITGRVLSDPKGTMRTEVPIINGTGSQLLFDRWGDYSSMAVDPQDNCTFWYTTEYLKTNGDFNWSTWIQSFRFPGCIPGDTDPVEAF